MLFVRNLALVRREYTVSSIAKSVLDSNTEITDEVAEHLRRMVENDYIELYVPVTADYRLYGTVFNNETQSLQEPEPLVTGEEYNYFNENNCSCIGFLTLQDAFVRRSQLLTGDGTLTRLGAMLKIGCVGKVAVSVYAPDAGGLSIGIRPSEFSVINRIKPQGIHYAVKSCYSDRYSMHKQEAHIHIIRHMIAEAAIVNGRSYEIFERSPNTYYSKYYSLRIPSELNITGGQDGRHLTDVTCTEVNYGTLLNISNMGHTRCVNILAPGTTVISRRAHNWNKNISFNSVPGVFHGKLSSSILSLLNSKGSVVSVAGDGNSIVATSRDSHITVLGSTNNVSLGSHSTSTIVEVKGHNNIVSSNSSYRTSISITGNTNSVNHNGYTTYIEANGIGNNIVLSTSEHHGIEYASGAVNVRGDYNVITMRNNMAIPVSMIIKASRGTALVNGTNRIIVGETEGYPANQWIRVRSVFAYPPTSTTSLVYEVTPITDINDPLFTQDLNKEIHRVILNDINGG